MNKYQLVSYNAFVVIWAHTQANKKRGYEFCAFVFHLAVIDERAFCIAQSQVRPPFFTFSIINSYRCVNKKLALH